uniref:Ku domain-containing protein n=1 Tax=Denticeps clupeoides TaxID=299321 RepID=A0AAY4AVH0_9TELE
APRSWPLVLCMDVGFSMSNSAPGQEPFFEQAKKILQKFVQRQVFAESKDELALVLFGTDNTDNRLADGGQYQYVTVHRHLMLPDFELLEEIQNSVHPCEQQADWLDALVVCMDLLQNETMGKKYDRLNVALLTDLNFPVSADQLDIIIGNLKRAGITLQFFLPFPAEQEECGQGGGAGDGNTPRPPRGKGLTKEQQNGLEMVRQVMASLDEEDGLEEIYTFSDAIEKLSVFKRTEKRPMAWPCQLTIGSSLPIRIVGYKAVTEEKVKKTWTMVDAQTHRKEDVKRDTVFCLQDDNETEIEKDDIVQGFRYGSDIVPFSKVDQEQMKYKCDGKAFAVLGFARQSLVKFMGTQAIKVFAAKDDEVRGTAAGEELKPHGVKLGVDGLLCIIPACRGGPVGGRCFPLRQRECLIYVQLPYMEDLRQFQFGSLENNKKFAPTEEQLAAVDSLIDTMMLVEESEGGVMEDLFKVNNIPNPQFQRLFQCLHHRGVNPGSPLPPVDAWLKKALERPEAVAARCQAALAKAKKLFPLKEVERKREQKTSADIFGSRKEEPDAKKVKLNEETDYNFAEISEGTVTKVSEKPRESPSSGLNRFTRDLLHLLRSGA